MKYEWHFYIKYMNILSTVTVKTIDYIKRAFHVISSLLLNNFSVMMHKDDGMIQDCQKKNAGVG